MKTRRGTRPRDAAPLSPQEVEELQGTAEGGIVVGETWWRILATLEAWKDKGEGFAKLQEENTELQSELATLEDYPDAVDVMGVIDDRLPRIQLLRSIQDQEGLGEEVEIMIQELEAAWR